MKPILTVFFIAVLFLNAEAQNYFQKTFGGPYLDGFRDASMTADSGFIMTGFVETLDTGDRDMLLIRTDANGDTMWTGKYGTSKVLDGMAVEQTMDGGFIVGGISTDMGGMNV